MKSEIKFQVSKHTAQEDRDGATGTGRQMEGVRTKGRNVALTCGRQRPKGVATTRWARWWGAVWGGPDLLPDYVIMIRVEHFGWATGKQTAQRQMMIDIAKYDYVGPEM